MLSVVSAALLDRYLTLMILELVASPESKLTPVMPPTALGNCHWYPVAPVTAAAVYL